MNKLYYFKCIILIIVMTFFAIPTQAEVKVTDSNDIVWYRVHFGLGVGSKSLNPDIFTRFLNSEITPRFPKGLTLTFSHGQWKSPQGLVREKVAVVDLLVDDIPENLDKVEELAEIYVKKFANANVSTFVTIVPNIKNKLFHQ